MRTYRRLGRIVQVALLLAAAAEGFSQAAGPVFVAEIQVERSPISGESRVTALVRLPLSSLSLVRSGSAFVGRYEITAEVHRLSERGRRTELVRTQIARREVPPVLEFAAARSDTVFDFTRVGIGDLTPGRYEVDLRVEDTVTRRSTERTIQAEVPAFSSLPAMSTILLMEQSSAGDFALRPNVANDFTTHQSQIVLSFAVYAARPADVHFTYDLYRLKGRGPKARPGDEPDLSLTAVNARRLVRGENRVLSSIPVADLRVGHYVVIARVVGSGDRTLVSAEKRFELRWSGLERQVRDLDDAIAQLGPIAKGKELEAMASAATSEEKRRRFEAFWKKRDPTPRTARNERMEEYYYRVWFADSRYSSPGGRGWRSDRGKVYLRFGEPDKTDRYPINAREKFEVWTYAQLNRRFIFVDRSGDGTFVLFRPIWDERNKIR